MTMFSGLLSSKVVRLSCVLAAALGFSSCNSPNGGRGGSPYASSDGGGYNPYPNGGGGAVSSNSLTPRGTQPQYAEAPPPPPPGFDRPSDKFEPEPTPKHHTSSTGTGKTKSKSKTGSSTASTAKKGGYVASGGNVHTVTKGDTLYAIATHNHTTVAKLKTLNHMKSNVVSPGQKIKVQ